MVASTSNLKLVILGCIISLNDRETTKNKDALVISIVLPFSPLGE